jgi:hypothetical protein
MWAGMSQSLRAGRARDPILVEARFSAPVQTGPGAHPDSYTMGIGSFPGVKRPGRGVDHPPPSSVSFIFTMSPTGMAGSAGKLCTGA